jgi:hypothetical protein
VSSRHAGRGAIYGRGVDGWCYRSINVNNAADKRQVCTVKQCVSSVIRTAGTLSGSFLYAQAFSQLRGLRARDGDGIGRRGAASAGGGGRARKRRHRPPRPPPPRRHRRERRCRHRAKRQGALYTATLVHFSDQPEPFLSQRSHTITRCAVEKVLTSSLKGDGVSLW